MDRNRFRSSIAEWIADVALSGSERPVVVGLSAPQGAGKTTLTRDVRGLLGTRGLRTAAISIDDFYLTREEQVALAARHPGNPYLEHRGNAGTHDLDLGARTLRELKGLRENRAVRVPAYDRTAYAGRGDRLAESDWPVVQGPLDAVIVEGWMLGFTPVAPEAIADDHLATINIHLAPYRAWHDLLDAFIWLEPEEENYVLDWRAEAEERAVAAGASGLTRAEVIDFIGRFQPAYATYYPAMRCGSPISGPYLHAVIGYDRLPISWVDQPPTGTAGVR